MASRNRKIAFGLITLTLMALVGAGLLEIVLRATAEARGNATFLLGKRWYYLAPIGIPEEMPSISLESGAYRGYDADLGWSIGKLGRGDEPNLIGKGNAEIYFSNAYGYRCDQETHEQESSAWKDTALPEQDASHYNYVCIGDSFTHGDAVLAEEAWPARLAARMGASVANLGVGGYGIDQAVMRYDTKKPSCDHVLLGLISGDLERATYLIYNFNYGDVKSKPIYEFEDGKTSIFNRPARHGEELLAEYRAGPASKFFARAKYSWDPRLLKRSMLDLSYCLRTARSIPLWRADRNRSPIYQEDGKRLDYCVRIITHLRELTAARSAKTTVILLGEANSFADSRSTLDDNWSLLKAKLDALGIQWIDTTEGLYSMFKDDPANIVNATDGVHYTPQANARVAEIVAQHLTENP